MRSWCVWLISPWAATLVFWSCFGACVVPDPPAGAPEARVVVDWDPTACGVDPHRVVLELADDAATLLSTAAPCALGAVELDAVAYGSYRGRVYAWAIGEAAHSIAPVELDVDARVVRTTVATPR
jgi:hypothetical protein